MKKLVFVGVLVLSQLAMAKSYTCTTDFKDQPTGYLVSISKNNKKGIMFSENLGGQQPIDGKKGRMLCERASNAAANGLITQCWIQGANSTDSGFSVIVRLNQDGATQADIYSYNMAGLSDVITTLKCR